MPAGDCGRLGSGLLVSGVEVILPVVSADAVLCISGTVAARLRTWPGPANLSVGSGASVDRDSIDPSPPDSRSRADVRGGSGCDAAGGKGGDDGTAGRNDGVDDATFGGRASGGDGWL